MDTATLVQAIATVVEADTTLKPSVLLGSTKGQPASLDRGHFSIDVQSTVDDLMSSRKHFWMQEAVTVDFVWSINMMKQFDSQVEALVVEKTIIAAMLKQSNIPGVSTFFEGARRVTNNTKEYLVVSLSFTCSYSHEV
jgi:hypothetical protein